MMGCFSEFSHVAFLVPQNIEFVQKGIGCVGGVARTPSVDISDLRVLSVAVPPVFKDQGHTEGVKRN